MVDDRAVQRDRLLPVAGEAVAVRTPEGHRTWDELEGRARRVARAVDRVVGPGGRWAVLANNRVEWPELMLGNARAGTRLVPLNWHLTAHEIAELLDDAQAELLVVDPVHAEVAQEAAARVGVERIVVFGEDYEQWIAEAGDEVLDERPVGTVMLYTGGTTGRSKGVTRSDRGGVASDWAKAFTGWGRLVRMPPHGRSLLTTPLYHTLGSGVLSASLALGKAVTILPRFDPEDTLRRIGAEAVTTTTMVPTQFIRLLKLPDETRHRYDLSSLEWVLHTAAPCPEWVKRAMIDWFGPVIYELYGSSEGAGPAICDSHEWLAHPGTVGRATSVLEYSIVDDDGADLPPGEIGTIYVRRLDGTPEYHGAPEKTAEMQLPDGRFTVGDLGWLDDDGFLYLADRRVDLIISGGANIYPAEIEGVLVEHPDVADAAVFGVPHPEFGQEVKAVVERLAGRTVDVADLATFAASRLASYKRPKSIDVVDQLPREAHGKLKKRLLRDAYWADES